MRNLSFLVAGVFSVLAILLSLMGFHLLLPGCALTIAAISLVIGLAQRYKAMGPQVFELDDEQRAEIVALKKEGKHAQAIGQVNLWFRQISSQEAQRLVREA